MNMLHPFNATAILLLFLSLKATIVASKCNYHCGLKCSNNGFSSTDTVTFSVDDDTSGSDSEYEATVTFLWALDEEEITGTYSRGNDHAVTRTFTHGYAGTFIVGCRIAFGEGAGCEGSEFEELFELTYDVENKLCDFPNYYGEYIQASPPDVGTPPGPEPPEPATPEPTTPEPATPEPTAPEPTAPEPTAPEPTAPEPAAPEPAAPEPTMPDLKTPAPSVPVVDIPTSPEPTEGEDPSPPPFYDVELPACGDGECEPTTEDYDSCPDDCSAPPTPSDSTPSPPTFDETNHSPTNVNDRPAELPSIAPTEEGYYPGCCELGCDSDCGEPVAAYLEESGDSGKSPNNNMYFIIAGAAGGACGIAMTLVLGLYFARRGKRRHDATRSFGEKSEPDRTGLEIETKTTKSLTKNSTENQQGGSHLSIQQGESYFGTIQQTDVDDISTLGDPYMGEVVNPAMNTDMTVGGESLKSQLHIYGVGPSPNGNASRMGDTTVTGSKGMLFGEDATLEDIYQNPLGDGENTLNLVTVVAPAGKLGIVLNNPHGDLPVVYAIKESSVLRGMVWVGDFLISVDEVDCRGMTSHKVSSFLSSRSQNPARTLVLARGSAMNNILSTAAAV